MRICIDIDGVIAPLRREGETYNDVAPVAGAPEKIRSLKANGHYIILHTARHMKTCNGNVGMVMSKIGKITIDWLERYHIPYDELHFGKPQADIYIDDNAWRFTDWKEIADDGANLPDSHEQASRRRQ